MDANEQRAVALLKEAAGGNVVIHPDTGYVNIEWAIRAIMAALAQQVPADGEWERFGNLLALEGSPRLIDAWNKLHSQSATPQAPQPVVDDNGLIVHGDWFTVEHTGTHIFDLDDDRERLLSILLHSNGDVGFAARVEGVGSWQGKATDPVFREALAALGDPRRHDLALGTNPPASQPQQGAVAWEVSDGIAKSFAWKESDTAPWRNEPGYTIRPLIYGDTIGQQAADDAALEKALRASLEFVSKFTSGNSVMRDVRAIAVRAGPTIAQEATSLRDQINAALAAHGKGG